MTRTIVAILALSPAMLFAQAHVPAQPSSTPVLHASLLQPAALVSEKSENGAAPGSLRISTGVVAPKLVSSVSISSTSANHVVAIDRKVVVEMTVSESGKPCDLKVVESADPAMNDNVIAAVSRFQYKPGTLDGTPAAVPVRLEITIPRGTAY